MIRLLIEVEPVAIEKIYYIIFEDTEEIQKIQKLYKKYEQIIIDLNYDFVNDRIYIKNNSDINLNYVSNFKLLQKYYCV